MRRAGENVKSNKHGSGGEAGVGLGFVRALAGLMWAYWNLPSALGPPPPGHPSYPHDAKHARAGRIAVASLNRGCEWQAARKASCAVYAVIIRVEGIMCSIPWWMSFLLWCHMDAKGMRRVSERASTATELEP